jgi:hypothetical protein
MNSKLVSIGLSVTLTLCMGLLGKVGCDNMKLEKRTSQLNAKLMEADLEIGRAETQFGSAQKYIKELEKTMQTEIKARKAEITRYGELNAQYKALKSKQAGRRTKIIYRDGLEIRLPAKLKLTEGMLYQAVSSNTLISIKELEGEFKDHRLHINAKALSAPNHKDYIKWEFSYDLDLKLEAQFIETITPTGAINHYSKLYEIDEDGNRQGEFTIKRFQFVVENPNQKSLFWWAPHFDVGALGMLQLPLPQFTTGGSIGVSISGYGLTVNDLDWRFLRFSFDLSDGLPGMGLAPMAYNLGRLMPLISNLWVGPHVGYSLNSNWKIGLFMGAVL